MHTISNFIKNDEIKNYIVNPSLRFLYNELYLYIWIICLYNIVVFIMILSIFFLLIRYHKRLQIYMPI